MDILKYLVWDGLEWPGVVEDGRTWTAAVFRLTQVVKVSGEIIRRWLVGSRAVSNKIQYHSVILEVNKKSELFYNCYNRNISFFFN